MLELASRLRAIPNSSWGMGEFAARIPDDVGRMILQEYHAHQLKRMAMRELQDIDFEVKHALHVVHARNPIAKPDLPVEDVLEEIISICGYSCWLLDWIRGTWRF